jgi:hypothetical protein
MRSSQDANRVKGYCEGREYPSVLKNASAKRVAREYLKADMNEISSISEAEEMVAVQELNYGRLLT